MAGGVGEHGVGRLAGGDPGPDALEGAGERVDGRRLDGVDARQRRVADRKPAMTDDEQGAAADLDDQPVEARGPSGAPTAAASSQPSVSPPSMARPLRLPWQVNGTAPASIARSSAWYGRVAGDARLALADRERARRATGGARPRPGRRRSG